MQKNPTSLEESKANTRRKIASI